MSAEIVVTRSVTAWRDRLRAFKLVVDDETVASVRQGETARVSVDAGRHRVWMKIDWGRSRTLDVDLADGECVRLTCRPAASYGLTLLYITIWRGRYIDLQHETTEGKIPSL